MSDRTGDLVNANHSTNISLSIGDYIFVKSIDGVWIYVVNGSPIKTRLATITASSNSLVFDC